ncbi:MAG: glycoside hydrolase family 97 protein [Ignavibacteriales bacterium]
MKKFRLMIIFYFAFNYSCFPQGIFNVTSPDGNVNLKFGLSKTAPYYIVQFKNEIIIDTSFLGFEFKNNSPIQNNLAILESAQSSFDEIWHPLWGERKSIKNNYNELNLTLIEKSGLKRNVKLVFRVFNDGVGFRYEFPKQENLNYVEITDELTQFNFADDYLSWWIPADYDSYEYLYNTTKLSEIDLGKYNYPTRGDRTHPNQFAVNTPITMKTESGIYLSIHEAELFDYSDMTLERKEKFLFQSHLVPWSDGIKVKTQTPFKTPWRVILISPNAGGLVESSLILNLNEPNKLTETNYIEPMKYIGVWWEMHVGKSSWAYKQRKDSWSYRESSLHGANTENVKRYIDFASKHNIRGVLVEGWNTGWEFWGADSEGYFDFVTPNPDFDINFLVEYARSKNVELIGHHETGGQATNYEKHLENAFKFYNSLGIKAVKTGYAGSIIPKGERHHGQYMIGHYRKVIETAAKYNIMVNAHEPIEDTGERRTFPNMMSREGVRGMEWNAWSDGNPPEHTTIIPFTRGLGGPIDYTPGIFDLTFDKYKDKERVQSTLANQLALYVVLYSPLQMAADLIENYESNPAFEFIEKVPVDWDESKVLVSEIGDYIVVARKNNGSWYVGGITDENKRSLKINFDFLIDGKNYQARIFKDSEDADYLTNPTGIKIEDQTVNSKSTIEFNLARAGGFAIILSPIE